jgi:hypothetical protein
MSVADLRRHPFDGRRLYSHAAARSVAIAAAIAAAVAGMLWGTQAAGGPDSYCYLSQAELFAAGHVMHVEPLAALAPWQHGGDAFVPVGHIPAFDRVDASVPMCAPGYPLAMAMVRRLAGRNAMFAVVPVLGAIAVWLTFVLGCHIGGSPAGAVAAVLLAASPPFLYQVVQPMSDVPAAALWAASLVAVTHPRFASFAGRSVLAGMTTGAALLIRPNLVPIAGVVALVVFCDRPVRWRSVVRTWGAFAAGLTPFVILVGLLQNEMYGSPLKSGYGDLRLLFKVEHVWPNLQRYSSWLLQTETPVVLLALATPWLMRDPLARRRAIWLLAFAGAVFACYIPYEVFDAWWYLRFVLPAYPALLVLTAAALTALLSRSGALWQSVGFAAVAVLAVVLVREGVKRHAFGLWEFERRFRLAGEYVASRLPENAIVITAQESGSVRFYSDRSTLTWRALPADGLDQALTFVRAHGYRPYLLIETGEQSEFVQQFEGKTSLGGLGWPPLADINHMLRIYDPDDYARYRAGIAIRTERVWTTGRKKGIRYRF